MATTAQELNSAEEAYAAVNELDKVLYLQYIKVNTELGNSEVVTNDNDNQFYVQNIPGRAERTAEVMMMTGAVEEAENILLRNGLPLKAIMVNIHTHNWNR